MAILTFSSLSFFQTLAEKAAWDYLKELPDSQRFELAVINPSYVIGPALSGGVSTAQSVSSTVCNDNNRYTAKKKTHLSHFL